MSTIEEIVEQVRSAAGADFAFLLTLRGRLVTRDAPQDMPEAGRARLVTEALPLRGSSSFTELTMAREELVPYGGAAPIDVYLAVAVDKAILCVVLSTWSAKAPVGPAIEEGLHALGAVLGSETAVRPPRARRSEAPRPLSQPPSSTGAAKAKRGAAALVSPAGKANGATQLLGQAPLIQDAPRRRRGGVGSHPEISDRDLTPEIDVKEGQLGRESLLALEREGRPPLSSTPEMVRVELESDESLMRLTPDPGSPRMTQPWVELPADTKRAVDAARFGRKVAAPRISVHEEEASEELIEAAQLERKARPSQPPARRRR